MKIYKTRLFKDWADDENLDDAALMDAVEEMESGLIDANLGGSVYKKRVAMPGKGKRGSVRTLLAFKSGDVAFFLYGFSKSAKSNISKKELKVLKVVAKDLLAADEKRLKALLKQNKLFEIVVEEKKEENDEEVNPRSNA